VLNLHPLKFTLLWLEVEFVFLQNVININAYNSLHYKVMENVIHHGLKSRQAVVESKEHYKWFKQALIHPEGCLPLVSLLNAYIIVTP
ncbi:hypothetical protein M422DRAFT_127551, partial [Sphaerobolus stellatus SS14]